MKLIHLLILIFGLSAPTFAQQSQTRSAQAEAIRLYPELGKPGSVLNQRFLKAVEEAKKTNDPILSRADWPLVLAKRLSEKRRLTPELLTTGEWKYHMTEQNFSETWTFTPDHKFSRKGSERIVGTWKINGRVLLLAPGGNWNEFNTELDESNGSLVLHETDSNSGKRNGITLTQRTTD